MYDMTKPIEFNVCIVLTIETAFVHLQQSIRNVPNMLMFALYVRSFGSVIVLSLVLNCHLELK